MLSPRERQVVDLVVDGRSNKDIGVELGISQKTV
ncbi:MAG: LuxR C-terminal-related transcriptional regulator, partial [Planctomycetaceae bacterium]